MELQHLDGSLSRFSSWSSIFVELKFENVSFCGGANTGESGEKPSEQSEIQQQTQPTMTPGRNRTYQTRAPSLLHPVNFETDLIGNIMVYLFIYR